MSFLFASNSFVWLDLYVDTATVAILYMYVYVRACACMRVCMSM